MSLTHSVQFFDTQFQQQVRDRDLRLNPFETAALPQLTGRVLDYGCGLGNLAFEAARRGCSVLALDGSPTAIEHVKQRAADEALPVEGILADLRRYQPEGEFDAVVCIGLLMFFDCATGYEVLERLKRHVRPGGLAVVNVLVEGTTFLDMFDTSEHCLFSADAITARFEGWRVIHSECRDFDAPRGTRKRFLTLMARKLSGTA